MMPVSFASYVIPFARVMSLRAAAIAEASPFSNAVFKYAVMSVCDTRIHPISYLLFILYIVTICSDR